MHDVLVRRVVTDIDSAVGVVLFELGGLLLADSASLEGHHIIHLIGELGASFLGQEPSEAVPSDGLVLADAPLEKFGNLFRVLFELTATDLRLEIRKNVLGALPRLRSPERRNGPAPGLETLGSGVVPEHIQPGDLVVDLLVALDDGVIAPSGQDSLLFQPHRELHGLAGLGRHAVRGLLFEGQHLGAVLASPALASGHLVSDELGEEVFEWHAGQHAELHAVLLDIFGGEAGDVVETLDLFGLPGVELFDLFLGSGQEAVAVHRCRATARIQLLCRRRVAVALLEAILLRLWLFRSLNRCFSNRLAQVGHCDFPRWGFMRRSAIIASPDRMIGV